MRLTCLFLLSLFWLISPPASVAQPAQPRVNIAVVADGPWELNRPIFDHFKREITELLSGEFDANIIGNRAIEANWSAESVRTLLDSLLTDPNVDMIVTAGVLTSHDVCFRGDLPKPVIAPFVLDKGFQQLPEKNGASGVKNLSYISFPASVQRDIAAFYEVVKFDKLAFLAPEYLIKNLRTPPDTIQVNEEKTVELVHIAVDMSVEEALEAIPDDVDAAYVVPLVHLSNAQFQQLVDGLIERKLPSFSLLGEIEVEQGLMFGLKPKTIFERLARRVALNIQSILLGEAASTIPTAFAVSDRLTLNMSTCRAIGFYPSWGVLTEAEVINPDRKEIERQLTLAGAVGEGIIANLDLKAKQHEVEAGAQNTKNARANLLPQLELGATGLQINEEQASTFQAEKTGQARATLSQVLYSDDAITNYGIQTHLQNARTEEERQLYLDTVQSIAEAYLMVLKAKTNERIQRENLKTTRSNMELAEIRVAVGHAGREETYRWQSELATSRANVIQANSQRNLAEIQLNRLLNRPAEEKFDTAEVDVFDPDLIMGEGRILNYMDNPQAFKVLRSFMVDHGLENAPELSQLDASIAAQEKAAGLKTRAFWLPTVAMQGEVTHRFYEDGAGSDPVQLPPNTPPEFAAILSSFGGEKKDTNWNVALSATFPLYRGGAKFSERVQAAETLKQLRLQRQSVADKIEQNIRSALHVAGASYASIQQAQIAADAAGKSLTLVTDAYSRGVVSIIDLIDAQNAALVAELAAANAVYDFVIDIMNVERAVGEFVIFATPAEKDTFFEKMDMYFETVGATDTIRND